MDSYYTSTVLNLASPKRASGMEAVKYKLLHDQGIQSAELFPFCYIIRRSPIILIKHLKSLVSLTFKHLKYFSQNKNQVITGILLAVVLFLKLEYTIFYKRE